MGHDGFAGREDDSKAWNMSVCPKCGQGGLESKNACPTCFSAQVAADQARMRRDLVVTCGYPDEPCSCGQHGTQLQPHVKPVKLAPERVDHPAHYGGKDNPYEVIKVLREWLTPDEFRGFVKGNVIKYLARANLKGATQEDHKKAAWYARELAEVEKP